MSKRWNIAKARASFALLLKKAQSEPQEIENRGELVAVVVDPRQIAFNYNNPHAEMWALLDEIKKREDIEGLPSLPKQSVRDPFEKFKEEDDVSHRHKRHIRTNKKTARSKGRRVA